MRCEVCGKDRPLTYRSRDLLRRSVCAPCIRKHWPETLPDLHRADPFRYGKAR